MILNCGAGEDSWESLEFQGNQTSQYWRKSNLNIHLRDWCWSSNTLAIGCNGKDPDAGTDWRQKRKGWQRMRWLDSIANSMDMNVSKLRETVKYREAWHASPWGCKQSDKLATEQQHQIIKCLIQAMPMPPLQELDKLKRWPFSWLNMQIFT